MLKNEELAWAAGFFDGEGCCYFQLRGCGIKVVIGQKDRYVLDRFQTIFNLGQVFGPYRRGDIRSIIYYYQLYGLVKVTNIMNAMSPWLSPIKLEQYHSAVDTFKSIYITRVTSPEAIIRRTKTVNLYGYKVA